MAIWTSPLSSPAMAGGAVVLTICTGAPYLSNRPCSIPIHSGAKLGLAPTQATVMVPGLAGGMAAAEALALAPGLADVPPLAAGLAEAAVLAAGFALAEAPDAALLGLAAALAGAAALDAGGATEGAAEPPQAASRPLNANKIKIRFIGHILNRQ